MLSQEDIGAAHNKDGGGLRRALSIGTQLTEALQLQDEFQETGRSQMMY